MEGALASSFSIIALIFTVLTPWSAALPQQQLSFRGMQTLSEGHASLRQGGTASLTLIGSPPSKSSSESSRPTKNNPSTLVPDSVAMGEMESTQTLNDLAHEGGSTLHMAEDSNPERSMEKFDADSRIAGLQRSFIHRSNSDGPIVSDGPDTQESNIETESWRSKGSSSDESVVNQDMKSEESTGGFRKTSSEGISSESDSSQVARRIGSGGTQEPERSKARFSDKIGKEEKEQQANALAIGGH
ncbi:hypothetical protein KP509_31G051400 [Ceratopteris richardii]|uniref:Uncharacterized protein n=1 Tax=Ceratopteris richardii TaxID=49495 RepID=A0A8T2QXX9_CERRI|nr:hypothetical protein KP509_31G051400 [Ceratopteris richardii]